VGGRHFQTDSEWHRENSAKTGRYTAQFRFVMNPLREIDCRLYQPADSGYNQ
jgi:hypothetical protein